MTEPVSRIGPWTALSVFLRSRSLRAAAASRARARWGARIAGFAQFFSILFLVVGFIAAVIGFLIWAPQKIGLTAYAMMDSRPLVERRFYAIGANTVEPGEWGGAVSLLKQSDAQYLSYAPGRRAQAAREDARPMFGLSSQERARLLRAIGSWRERRGARTPLDWAAQAQLLARLLTEGKTPEQAAAALRSTASQTGPIDAELRVTAAFERALLSAQPVDPATLSIFERFAVSADSFPDPASSLAYAEWQSHEDRRISLWFFGLALLCSPLLLWIAGALALSMARDKAKNASPELLLEWERQRLERVAKKAPPSPAARARRL